MTIVACPKCADSVVLPGRAGQRATVRCPLCQEEFPLAEVLDKMPPALIVVDDPDAAATMTATAAAAPESDPVPRLLEPEARTGGFAPLSIETASSGAPAIAARRRPAAAAKRKPKSPLAEGVKIVLGGVAGLVIAQVILWWIGSAKEWPSKRADISGLAPKVARYVPWIVPERYRGQKTSGVAVGEPETRPTASEVAGESGGVPPKELPQRNFVDPSQSGSAPGTMKSPVAKTKKPGKSPRADDPQSLPADAREEDPFGIAPAGAEPEIDLTTMPEPETDPLAEMKLDPEPVPDDKPVADPAVSPVEEAKVEPAEATKAPAEALPNAPRTTAAELASAAENAKTVIDAWRSSPEADSRELIKQSYVALAKLGEALAFRREPAGDELQTAAALVQSLQAEDAKLNTLGAVAGVWLKATGRDNNGVLLVGAVKHVRRQAGYEVIELTLAGGSGQSVAVYRQAEPGEAHSPDSRLLVLGAIIEEPGKNLAGYEGDAPLVIWSGLVEKLPAP